MKRFLGILSALVLIVSLSAAVGFASDGASLYKRCAGCHGADGSKAAMNVSEHLKGQSAEDIEHKLHGYKDGSYGGAKKMIMKNPVKSLSDEDIEALAEYIAGF